MFKTVLQIDDRIEMAKRYSDSQIACQNVYVMALNEKKTLVVESARLCKIVIVVCSNH